MCGIKFRIQLLKDINEYVSISINPMKLPNTMFEMYSVPIYETGHPEYLSGNEIGSNKVIVKKNDVLLCKINPRINRVWVVSDESEHQSIASSEWIVIRSNTYNPEFLAWYFRCPKFKKLMISEVTGIGGSLTRAQPKAVAEYPVPVLSIDEQEKIVGVLNKVNSIIGARKRELQKLDELIRARFVEMFGSIHDNKYGYEIQTIQDVCEQIKDGTHQTPTYTEDSLNGFKFLSSKDVTSGKIDWNHLKYIPESLHTELYARIAPKKGDLLLAKNGTTGIAAIVDRDEIFDIYVSLALLRPIEIDSIYLWGAVNSQETKEQFDASLKGIGVPNLHLGEIKKTRIIVPPILKQKEFAAFVAQVDKSKQAHEYSGKLAA
jgi:type I restriction enzyme S subunit